MKVIPETCRVHVQLIIFYLWFLTTPLVSSNFTTDYYPQNDPSNDSIYADVYKQSLKIQRGNQNP